MLSPGESSLRLRAFTWRVREARISPLAFAISIGVLTVGAIVITNSELTTLTGIPAAIAGAALSARHPALAIGVAVALVGFIGTAEVLVPALPTVTGAEFVLLCLWLGIAWQHAAGERLRGVRVWPPMIPLILYVILTAASIPFADVPEDGLDSFRLSAYYILAVPFIGLAAWSAETLRDVARAVIGVAVVVGLFCVIRYATGPSADELLVAREAQPSLPFSETLRFFGSFLSAQELSAWCSVMVPFSLGAVLCWKGTWRVLAGAALALSVVALLASEVRTGLAAAAAGGALVYVLYVFAHSVSARTRMLTVVAGALALAVTITAAYELTIGGDAESRERIEGLASPSEDANFQIRKGRWELALQEIGDEPLGHGLGTTGAVAIRSESLPVGPPVLDSSYLKVGIEQGLGVMVFYLLAMVTLLVALGYRAMRTPSRERAAIALGATGALLALGLLFFGSLYAELPSAVLPGWVIVGLGCAQFTGVSRARSTPAR